MARASTFRILVPKWHRFCGLLSAALLAALFCAPAQADGVDAAVSRQIEHCIHAAEGPVETCLMPVITSCGESRAASACDYNISGEALDIAAADHPGLAAEIRAFRVFIGEKCAASASPDSWGALRIAEHALCVRSNRLKLVELLIADR